ncbi:MAG: cell division protein FtsH, partial [Anaerolineae bacterium]
MLILAAVAALVFTIFPGSGRPQEVDITEVAAAVRTNQVSKISVREDELTVEFKDRSEPMSSRKETGISIFEVLNDLGVSEEHLRNVEIEVVSRGPWDNWVGIGITVLPLLVFGGLLFFMVRQAQGSNNQALSFGKSRARMFAADKPSVTFDDVAGADEAKQE